MQNKTIKIFDTTLRDGEQAPGASMTKRDKIKIGLALDEAGIDVIEAGFAFASKKDFEAIEEIAKNSQRAAICSLARAKEDDIVAAANSVSAAKNGRVHIFLATSDIHLEHKLHKTRPQLLEMLQKNISFARSLIGDVEWSAEDATRTDLDFLTECVDAAIDSGATVINLPDTVGFTHPEEYRKMFEYVIKHAKRASEVTFSAHCHNDLGMATANAIYALLGGATQVECTINGIGERAGNVALEEVMACINVRKDILNFDINFDTKKISELSKMVSVATGFAVQKNKSVVGDNAFVHESGIHQDGILKNRSTYEVINPDDFGIYVASNVFLGKLSGRNALKQKFAEFGVELDAEKLSELFAKFKVLAESKKFIVDADLMGLLNDEKIAVSPIVKFESHSVQDSTKENELLDEDAEKITKVVASIVVRGKHYHEIGVGNGQIDAILTAINKVLDLKIHLADYGLQAVSSGTDAKACCKISAEHNGVTYYGSSVNTDIIVASVNAYIEVCNKILTKEDENEGKA